MPRIRFDAPDPEMWIEKRRQNSCSLDARYIRCCIGVLKDLDYVCSRIELKSTSVIGRSSVICQAGGVNLAVKRREVLVTTWDSIPQELVRRGVRRRAFGTEYVTLVLNEVEPSMDVAPHVHETFDQIALILEGHAIYHVGNASYEVGPGSVMLIPAGEQHWIEPRGDDTIQNLDIFAPACSDYSHLLEWMATKPDSLASRKASTSPPKGT